ncbi:formylglycine-generating enzyme family protein [Gracilibacillus lacisalsi]|uniref:formylglycine-generating enzyme family protein n=1 Tax=Gracilibacillus lacisalsi TaxID=393087 RepID=UPI00038273A6|nr:formylglycine-generating enzyme family protein [Gracilibacillus lacisalsi]
MEKENQQASCCSVNRASITDAKTETSPVTNQKQQVIKFKDKMVLLDGGAFLMGTEDDDGFPADQEGPVRKEEVQPFYIDSHTVTNAEFKAFVDETGYKTEAEVFGWSFVFHLFLQKEQVIEERRVPGTPWWLAVDEAFWYQPEGPGSSIDERMDHPVIHVSWNDAVAFCDWAGKRLPTEKEWEYAARGGLVQKKYAWGDELHPNGEHYCNIWQGEFPVNNTTHDGYIGTAPAVSFPPNGYGLYNVSGNVWEWCADPFENDNTKQLKYPGNQIPRVMRGGSYLCHHSYCNRYRVAARSANTMDSSTGNLGFRCVADI